MGIKKYTSYILCIGLVLSSVGSLQADQVGRPDEAREKMNLFQRSLKSFRRTLDRYNRCIRGKCFDEEKQRVKQELKVAAKKTVKYGAIVIFILGAIALGRSIRAFRAKLARLRDLKAKYTIFQKDDEMFVVLLISLKDPGNARKRMQTFGSSMEKVTSAGRMAGAEAYYGHEPTSDEFYRFEELFFGDHKPVPAAGIIPAEVISATYPPRPGEAVPVVQPMGASETYGDVD